jgi:hypothetical protein
VIADGISCRLQIAHGTGRPAYHLAEVLSGAPGQPAQPATSSGFRGPGPT